MEHKTAHFLTKLAKAINRNADLPIMTADVLPYLSTNKKSARAEKERAELVSKAELPEGPVLPNPCASTPEYLVPHCTRTRTLCPSSLSSRVRTRTRRSENPSWSFHHPCNRSFAIRVHFPASQSKESLTNCKSHSKSLLRDVRCRWFEDSLYDRLQLLDWEFYDVRVRVIVWSCRVAVRRNCPHRSISKHAANDCVRDVRASLDICACCCSCCSVADCVVPDCTVEGSRVPNVGVSSSFSITRYDQDCLCNLLACTSTKPSVLKCWSRVLRSIAFVQM